MKKSKFVIVLLFAFLVPFTVLAESPPPISKAVYGDVLINENQAAEGVAISVEKDSVEIANTTVNDEGKYIVEVPAEYVGEILDYKVDNVIATSTVLLDEPAQEVNLAIDTIIPTLTSVNIVSDYADTSYAKSGNTVTITFSASEVLDALPVVTIDGNSADAVNDLGANDYSATRVMQAGDTNGIIAFTIDFTDEFGNNGEQATSTTDASSVNFDEVAPSAYTVSVDQSEINSDNKTALSFTFAGAEVNTEYHYSIDDTDAGTVAITATGTVSTVTDQITNIDVSSLTDGTLTLTVYLSDSAENQGNDTTDTVAKDTTVTTPAPASGGGGGGGGTYMDTTPPTNISILINDDDEESTSMAIVLTLSATGASQMMIANDSDFSDMEWETYITQKDWNLISGDGEKVVYAKFKDLSNNTSSSVQDIITLLASSGDGEEAGDSGDGDNEEEVIVLGLESDYRTIQLEKILDEANYISAGDANLVVDKMGLKRDPEMEVTGYNKYVLPLISGVDGLEQSNIYALTNFIIYGTETTKILGIGERAGALNSYKSAFGKLPSTESEWADVIKIANGRWPDERSESAETMAKEEFEKVYLRVPDMDNPNDNAAVTIIAYGLRPDLRNLESETNAINTFRAIFKHDPSSATDWDIVRAIAYSGAIR